MKPHFTETELHTSRPSNLLPCYCYNCNNIFYVEKRLITYEMKNKRGRHKFCSVECHSQYQWKRTECTCSFCGKNFVKETGQMSKSGNNFCSHSCSARYSNAHKKSGTRVSKPELYIQKELKKLYLGLEMSFNKTGAINAELDVYIPALRLAFEVNGIIHYKPIFGVDKLTKIQNNDNHKIQACRSKKIELHTIDISEEKYFKEEKYKKYLNRMTIIIDNKMQNLLDV